MPGPVAVAVAQKAAKNKYVRLAAGGLVGCLVLIPTLIVLATVAIVTAVSTVASVSSSTTAATACGSTPSAVPAYVSAEVAYGAGFRGTDLITAVAIAGAESSWNANPPDNTNFPGGPTATIDRGEWQVESIYAYGPPPVFGGPAPPTGVPVTVTLADWTQLLGANYNAQSFFYLYSHNTPANTFGWVDNDMFLTGTYKQTQFMDPANIAVGILTAVQAGKPPASGCPPPPTPAGNVAPVNCPGYYFSQGWGLTGNWEGESVPSWGWIDSGYLPSSWGRSWHGGIDIVCPRSSFPPVLSVAAGTVTFAGPVYVYIGGWAYCGDGVRVKHSTFSTFYNHLYSTLNVIVGKTVTAGQQIGEIYSGLVTNCTSGAHLHFQINYGKTQPTATSPGDDPCNYLPSSFVPASSMALHPYPCWNPDGYRFIAYPWYAY